MDKLDSTLIAAPLPCLSPLSGTVRPSTAAAAMEGAWQQLHRKPNRRWTYGVPQHKLQQQGPGQVDSLTGAARQQLSTIGKTAEAPYRRAMTPLEKAEIEKRVSKQVEVLAKVLQEAQLNAPTQPAATGSQQQPAGPMATEHQHHQQSSSEVSKPMTPQQVLQSIKDLLASRPNSSMSVQDLTLPRPSSKLVHVRGLPSLGAVTASWSGPLPNSASHPATPGSRPATSGSMGPRTPKRPGSRSLLRASAPAGPLCAPQGPGADVWVNPQARPGASEEQRDRALLRSSMGNAAAAHATGTASALQSSANATARLLINRGALVPGSIPSQNLVSAMMSRPVTAASALCAEGTGGATTKEMIHKLLEKPLGAPGNPRWGPGQPLQQFVPTRGLVYSVFSELDPGDSGKLTYSTFEEACVLCGLKKEQSVKLFEALDSQKRGYFTMRDWGSPEHEHQVMEFTRLYIHTTRGATGKPMDVREMKSVSLAVQVALHRLQIKNHGRVVSQDKLMHAFEFMDADGSGSLSLGEVQDGFAAMGIYVTPDVLHEIMERFDANKNGVIEYREFLGALYPVLSKAM